MAEVNGEKKVLDYYIYCTNFKKAECNIVAESKSVRSFMVVVVEDLDKFRAKHF